MNINVTYSGYTLADAASCVMMRLPVPDLVWDMEALWKVWNEPIPAITPEAVPEPAPEPVRRRGGECFAAKPVTYAGKKYPSIAALAKAYSLGYKTCFARLRDGLPLDAPINRHPLPYRGKPVTIDGKEYPSVKDASKALGIPYTTLITRIRKGQDLSAPKYADRCEPITYQGKEYPSIEALARATGISSRSWLYRIKHHIPLDAPWGRGGNKQEKPAAPEPEAAEPAPEQKPASSPQKFGLETCRRRLAAGLPLEEPEKLDGDLAGMRQIKTTPASDLKAYRMRFRACRYGGKRYTSLSSLADLADCTIGQAYKAVMASGKWIAEDEI